MSASPSDLDRWKNACWEAIDEFCVKECACDERDLPSWCKVLKNNQWSSKKNALFDALGALARARKHHDKFQSLCAQLQNELDQLCDGYQSDPIYIELLEKIAPEKKKCQKTIEELKTKQKILENSLAQMNQKHVWVGLIEKMQRGEPVSVPARLKMMGFGKFQRDRQNHLDQIQSLNLAIEQENQKIRDLDRPLNQFVLDYQKKYQKDITKKNSEFEQAEMNVIRAKNELIAQETVAERWRLGLSHMMDGILKNKEFQDHLIARVQSQSSKKPDQNANPEIPAVKSFVLSSLRNTDALRDVIERAQASAASRFKP